MPARDRSLDSTEYKIKRIPEARRNNNALHIVLAIGQDHCKYLRI